MLFLAMSEFSEYDFYLFGLKVGFLNLASNGFDLGFKKTVGKVLQPINSYTRFPEYHYFLLAIRNYIAKHSQNRRLRILDVGSPKLFGLYLARNFTVEVHLTDISHANTAEYSKLWHCIRDRAKGKATFFLQDARSLAHQLETFDIAYSMSVIEHVQGQGEDSHSVQEMIRVLKPGGLFLLSVPFGSRYVEQRRLAFSYQHKIQNDTRRYFFQRIYDKKTFEKQVLNYAMEIRPQWVISIRRKRRLLLEAYKSLNENMRGVLGFMNPWLSAWVNERQDGISEKVEGAYGDMHSTTDTYGDLIFCGIKESSKNL